MSLEYYRVVSPKCSSVLHSSSPSGAAAKAFSHCLSKSKKMKKKSRVISVQRRSGNQKVMSYKVKSIKNRGKAVERGGTMIHFAYKTKVKSLNVSRKSKSKKSKKSKSKAKKSKSKKSKSKSPSRNE